MSWNRGWANNQPTQSQQNRARNAPPSGGSSGRGSGGGTQTGGNQGGAGASNRGGFGWGSNFGPGTSATQTPVAPPAERPPMPDSPLPEGWTWQWNGTNWVPVEGAAPEEEEEFNNDAMAYLQNILEQFGLATPTLLEFARSSVAMGKSATQILQELRQQPDYLANPLFAANVRRAAAGGGWMAEGQVIAYAAEAKRLARQFGYEEPSDNYIAMGFEAGKSLAEYEHALRVQERVNRLGGGVAQVFRDVYGDDPGDEDLFSIFDPERDTTDIDRALRQAEYRGRPLALGLGIRSEAEARAFELLGVDPDEAFARYQQVAQNAPRAARFAAIEDLIAQGLPADWTPDFSTAENSVLNRAFLTQDPAAMAEVQQLYMREIARWKASSGAVAAQGGQQVGLLSQAERASFG
jgi:hypothetical protein